METRIMRRIAPLPLTAVALGLALSGCGPVNRGLESVNQPVVSRTDYVFDLSTGGAGLAPGEEQRLSGWFDSLRLGYGDRISVDAPSAYGATGSRDEIAKIAARYGLLLSREVPVVAGTPAPGQLRVIVSRSSAAVPDCSNWSRKSQPEFASSTMSNYGCATNSNLAAMVANPEDLVQGQIADGSGDPLSTAKAIKSYRDAEPTGKGDLKADSTGGKL